MLSWLLALVVGAGVALLAYWSGGLAQRVGSWVGIALRALAAAIIVAAILDAPLGFSGPPTPVVLLDASSSWTRAGDTTAWRAAVRSARELSSDSVLLFGDSVRAASVPDTPSDPASRLQPALLRALGSGRSVTVITDGELDDPASVLDALPGGSRVIVHERAALPDAAIASVDLPRYVTSGDSLSIRVSLVAGKGGAPPGRISVLSGDRVIATGPTDSIAPMGEQVLVLRGYWSERDNGPVLIRAALSAAGDMEVRNDTLTSAVEASTTPGVVFVSTAPDLDSRYALAVLRGTLSLPTRAFLRVSPGNWRLDGPLTGVEDAEVRRAVAEAPVVILHGDTALFGAPRAVARGSLALFSVDTDGGDWYPVAAPASPLAAALSAIPWDSLPPIEVSANTPRGDWNGLETRRGRQFDRRFAVAGSEGTRRVVVIGASGLWRWAFKGGVSADAFSALWGSVFDWIVAERSDERPASPAALYFREGERIRWRRGARSDTVATLAVTARRTNARTDTVVVTFPASATSAETAALPAGVYDVVSSGGASILVVNESYDMVPRRPSVSTGEIEGTAIAGDRRSTRRSPAVYVVVVLLLCAEWVLRRRLGLR